MHSCQEACCYVSSWIASNDGNNSTEFQISEYVSTIVFSRHEFYPRRYFKYTVVRKKPTVKYGKLCPRESDFNEEFEVPKLSVALSRVRILRSENSL